MPPIQTRFGFPPLPDEIVYPDAPPLSTPIAGLAGFWLVPTCACGRGGTYVPLRLLAAEHGWTVPLSTILGWMSCRTCGKRPVSVIMTDRPDRMGGDHCGGPEAWVMEVGRQQFDQGETCMPRTKIEVRAEGATEDEIARGVVAAQRVFDDAGVSAWDAAAAAFRRESPDEPYAGLDAQAIRREHHLANLWGDAVAAAQDACCAGSGKRSTFDLELVDQT